MPNKIHHCFGSHPIKLKWNLFQSKWLIHKYLSGRICKAMSENHNQLLIKSWPPEKLFLFPFVLWNLSLNLYVHFSLCLYFFFLLSALYKLYFYSVFWLPAFSMSSLYLYFTQLFTMLFSNCFQIVGRHSGNCLRSALWRSLVQNSITTKNLLN